MVGCRPVEYGIQLDHFAGPEMKRASGEGRTADRVRAALPDHRACSRAESVQDETPRFIVTGNGREEVATGPRWTKPSGFST
jgi:hypothetical protein